MKKDGKDSATKSIVKYSSSKVYMQLLGVVSAFVKPRLLTPELFGLFNILNLIPTYASYMHLGSRSSMRYLIPYHEKRNEDQKILEIKGAVFYGSLFFNTVLMIILFSFSLYNSFDIEVKIGLISMGFVVLLQWYYEYHIAFLKSHQNFRLIASSTYIKSSVTFFLIILIYLYGIYGVYLSVILSLILVNLYLGIKNPFGEIFIFRFNVFSELLKIGFPIMLFSISSILIRTSDRIIVSSFLGCEMLGYYGIASMVVGFLTQIPGAARDIIEPRLMQNIENNSIEENLKDYFFKPLINTAFYIPLLLGTSYFILPVIIPLILPRYIPGITPSQINIIGSYFFILAFPARGIIVANNWQLKALFLMISVLFINIVLSILLLKSGLGLNGVALGSAISFFILFITLLFFVKKGFCRAKLDWKSTIFAVFMPFVVMCIIIMSLHILSDILHVNKYIEALINTTIFCIIILIVVNYKNKIINFKLNKLNKIWKKQ